MEIDPGFLGRGTQASPIVRDDVPLVFYNHVVPMCRDSEGRSGTNEERSRKDQEYRETEVAHYTFFRRG